jgi:two-component system sensor histidine kinase KdpD
VFAGVALVLGELVVSASTTELKRREAEAARIVALEAVDRQRAMLLRSVSHDLRTPLSTIRAVASDLRSSTVYPQATTHELLGLVIDESDRLDRIVGNLLSYSRIEAGALQPTLEPLDLNELAEATVDRLSHLTRGLKVELRLDPRAPIVEGDFSQLDQVLTNLIENAARHSPDEGCITVETSSDRRFAHLAVIDDGPGIAAGGSADVFEPFVGTSSTTGLGLAICKAIVEAHGGSIELAGATGRGARLSVSLPLHG